MLGCAVFIAEEELGVASIGRKPQIVLRDAVANIIEITEGAERCLVYDRPLPNGGLYVDNLFGQRLALRTVDPGRLHSLTVTTMDERSRTTRATIPAGDSLRGFDVGDIGEAISRVVGTARLAELSRSREGGFQLRGADAVNLPWGLTASDVLADLRVLARTLRLEPAKDLKLLEQLIQERNPAVKGRLEPRRGLAPGGGSPVRSSRSS